jgi:hypothetical protein
MRGVLVAAALLAAIPSGARGQARPTGANRIWGELGLGAARQALRCRDCVRIDPIGGPVATAAIGLTLPRGFGVALVGREFDEFDLEFSQGSRYVVGLGQYTPPRVALLTLSAGAGWGHHHGEPSEIAINDRGAVVAAGVALRLPARSRFALSVTADVIQSIGGATMARPRLISGGLALSMASARANELGDR